MKKIIARTVRMARAYPKITVHAFSLPFGDKGKVSRLMESFTQLRTDYVLQQVWPMADGGVDHDYYDRTATTVYVVGSIRDRVVAGMRLTPVKNVTDSLSYSMWHYALCRQEFLDSLAVNLPAAGISDHDSIWDVTRLITEANTIATSSPIVRAESRVGLLKILARAAHETDAESPIWIFTTTDQLLRFMRRNHFDVTVLAEGRISSHDAANSYFCIVRPKEVIQKLKKNSPILYLIAHHNAREQWS